MMRPIRLIAVLSLAVLAACALPTPPAGAEQQNVFRAPLNNGADPFMVVNDGTYYLMTTRGDRLTINAAPSIGQLPGAEDHDVWIGAEDDPSRSTQIWAPALYRFDGADGRPWPHAVSPEVFSQFAADLQTDYRSTLDRFLVLDTIGAEHGREELRTLRQQLFARGEPAPRVLQQGLVLLDETDLRASLPQLRVPSLWISGRRDRLVPPAGMRAASALASRAEFMEIAGGGHAPFLGHADEVAAAIGAFASASSRHSREGGNPAALASPESDGASSQRRGAAPHPHPPAGGG